MNSVSLFQNACLLWLNAQDQSELTGPETELLCLALNTAAVRMWRLTPAHYRRRTLSVPLSASKTGTITATAGSRTFSGTFSGVSFESSQWQYCTIEAGGYRNEVRTNEIPGMRVEVNESNWSPDLLHPWQGTTGTHAAVLYADASVLSPGYLVDRVMSPFVDTLCDREYRPAQESDVTRKWCRPVYQYALSRVSMPEPDGDRRQRSLFRFSRGDGAARLFEATIEVIPSRLTVLDASVERELHIDEEVCDYIAQAAGIELQRHPRFRGGNLDLAIQAMDSVRAMPQSFHSTPNRVGTPDGW